MSDPVVIVGSGASGVHAAQTALELGRRVVMLDIGHPPPPQVKPDTTLNALKSDLDDPVRYFLGNDFDALILPEDGSEYYGIPPSKDYVFAKTAGLDVAADGFAPLMSYAAGGLGQAWTAGCYPFSDGELEKFPFGWDALGPAYSEVAERIGVSGVTDDDLSSFMPAHGGLQPPIALDAHSEQLLATYARKRERLNAGRGVFMGRARLASLSHDHAGRKGCWRCGRCLWGCPSQSLYTPSVTLALCRRHPEFTYLSGLRVDAFRFDDANRVTEVTATSLATGEEVTQEVGTLMLAAGTLSTARILLESLHRQGQRAELGGLMDNRQALMPFVNLARVGEPFDPESYQYNQLAVGVPGARPFDYVHGLATTLTTALTHPVIQSLPMGVRAATAVFRNIHSALGLMNINFPDTRREENRVALDVGPGGRARGLLVSYRPDAREPDRVKPMIGRFRGFLGALNCFAPPPMTRLRPMGASVHYAGTLPMTDDGGDLTTDRAGRCRPFENLHIADGSSFPALPAKNLTFTLMANATRLTREALEG